ncbi:phage shock protein operon transcriptional activator, partial [Salmonella enterica subsp. enterica serovar Infantis]
LFPGFTDRAKETLLHYARPGNVRELKNLVERSVYRHGSIEQPLDEIVIDPFQSHHADPPAPALPSESVTPDLPLTLREFQL